MRALLGLLGLLLAGLFTAVLVAGCGGGEGDRSAVATGITGTVPTPTRTPTERPTTTREDVVSPPTTTRDEVIPPQTVTREETQTETAVVTAIRTETTSLTATITTETTGITPAAAAAAGAAAASSQDESEDTTDWGWVAFGVLAGLVVIGLVVWWIRRRHTAKPAT